MADSWSMPPLVGDGLEEIVAAVVDGAREHEFLLHAREHAGLDVADVHEHERLAGEHVGVRKLERVVIAERRELQAVGGRRLFR